MERFGIKMSPPFLWERAPFQGPNSEGRPYIFHFSPRLFSVRMSSHRYCSVCFHHLGPEMCSLHALPSIALPPPSVFTAAPLLFFASLFSGRKKKNLASSTSNFKMGSWTVRDTFSYLFFDVWWIDYTTHKEHFCLHLWN